MTPAKKFLFDTAFSADGRIVEASPDEALAITAAELENARAEGYAAGKADGRKDAAGFSARLHTEALTATNAALDELCTQLSARVAALEADATHLAHAIGRSIAGAALVHFGEANIKVMIAEAMEDLRTATEARLRAHPAVVTGLDQALTAHLERSGAKARLSIIADPTLTEGEAHLDFAGGAYRFEPAAIAERIARQIDQMLAKEESSK